MLNAIYAPVKDDLAEVEAGLKTVSQVEPSWLSQLLFHSLESRGKRIRPALVFLSAKFADYNPARLLPMALAVEVLHTATLVHDDAIDHSARRRGRPTINRVWGDDKAVLLGDYMLAKAEDLVGDAGDLRVVKLFARTIMTLAAGELGQAFSAFNLEQSREQYFARIAAKTSSLITLATESGAILSQAPEKTVAALRDYGYNLGIAFQVVDDILDFAGNEMEMGKPTGSDLSEGTLTLPAMMIMERYPGDNPVRRIFKQGESKPVDINRATDLVRSSGVIDDCYKVASDYAVRAGHCLDGLPDGPARQALATLADYVVARRR